MTRKRPPNRTVTECHKIECVKKHRDGTTAALKVYVHLDREALDESGLTLGPVCGYDCAGANPPVSYCPMRDGEGPRMNKLREELAHALYAMDCAETEREYLREGKPLPPKWADPWSPSGTGKRQQAQYYEKADALLLVINADAGAKNAKLQAAIWAADELGVAVQKWTDYREKYGSGDGIQERRAKEALEKYWRVTGGAPALRGLGQ